MEAHIQHLGTPVPLPRKDVSVLGPVGEQIEASRDLSDKIGVTADIEKMAFSGMTASRIAEALKEKLEVVKSQAEGNPDSPYRNTAYFVRHVRMSLGVPPVENEAKFKAWKEQAPTRLKYGVTTVQPSAQENAATSQPSAQPKDNANAETPIPEAVKASPEKAITAIDDEATKRRPDERQKPDTGKTNEMPKEAHGLNAIERSIEPNLEKDRQKSALANDEEAKRLALLQKADEDKTRPKPQPATDKKASDNTIESNEIFTASQADTKPIVPQEIEKQYVRVGGKFYHPKNTGLVAFEDKGNKLETGSNSEHIAESMVRIAEARGWDEIKVSGSETFRREVWLEAASRGMEVKGYSPSEQDKAQLAKRASERPANNLEKGGKNFRLSENNRDDETTVPRRNGADVAKGLDGAKGQDAAKTQASSSASTDVVAGAEAVNPKVSSTETPRLKDSRAEVFRNQPPEEAVKAHPELAGAYATVAALDKKAQVDGLDEKQRSIVSALVREFVASNIERGHIPNTKLRDDREVTRSRSNERDYSR